MIIQAPKDSWNGVGGLNPACRHVSKTHVKLATAATALNESIKVMDAAMHSGDLQNRPGAFRVCQSDFSEKRPEPVGCLRWRSYLHRVWSKRKSGNA